MLTNAEFQTLTSIFRLICKLHLIPMDWDDKFKSLRPTKNKVKKCICVLLTIRLLLYTVSINIQLHPAIFSFTCENSPEKIIMHIIMSLFSSYFLTESLQLNTRCDDFCFLFNQITRFNTEQGMNY